MTGKCLLDFVQGSLVEGVGKKRMRENITDLSKISFDLNPKQCQCLLIMSLPYNSFSPLIDSLKSFLKSHTAKYGILIFF